MSAPTNARIALFLSIILTLLLWWVIPFGGWISWPLLLLSTFAHELGHGLAALSVGHGFEAMTINWDGSGVTMSSGNGGRVASAWIAAGGLIGPAIAAAALFRIGKNARTSRGALLIIGCSMLILDVWVVRNLFGFIFVAGFGTLFIILSRKGGSEFARFTLIFLATQLSLSVFSRSDYLFTRNAGSGPSDVAHMANALWLPYWFWGLVCGGVSIAVLIFGIAGYVRR